MLELLRTPACCVGAATPVQGALVVAAGAITDDSLPVCNNLRELGRVASNLRERLSLDNWRTINRLTQALTQRRTRKIAFSDLLGELDLAIASFTTLSGFALDGMTRDPGWRFLSIGRRLERLEWLYASSTRSAAARVDLTGCCALAIRSSPPRPLHGAARMAARARSPDPRRGQPRSIASSFWACTTQRTC